MSWSVCCTTDKPYLYVISYHDFIESKHLHCHHIGFGKKTFVWYFNEADYLEDINLPYWRQYGKLNNSNGIYIDNDTPFINEIIPAIVEAEAETNVEEVNLELDNE